MGIFDFLKPKTPESTADVMCNAYHDALKRGYTPKLALKNVYSSISHRSKSLSNIDADYFLNSIFKEEYIKLSDNPEIAKEFVIKVIMNILSSNLHPEISSMNDAMNLTADSFMNFGEKEKKIENYVRKII